jgi:hypothetical protein
LGKDEQRDTLKNLGPWQSHRVSQASGDLGKTNLPGPLHQAKTQAQNMF